MGEVRNWNQILQGDTESKVSQGSHFSTVLQRQVERNFVEHEETLSLFLYLD